MFTDNIATADGNKSNIALLARARDPVTTPVRHILERFATAFRRSFTQHQRGARRCVYFLVVVRLYHFNVEILVERGRDAFGELDQQVYAEAHIACTHQCRRLCRSLKRLQLFIAHACRAYNVNATGAGGRLGKGNCCCRCGKIDHGVRDGKGFVGIIGHDNPARGTAHHLTKVATDPVVTRPLEHRRKFGLFRGIHGLHQHLAHATRNASDGNLHRAVHDTVLSLKSADAS